MHTGRSPNDQILVATRRWLKARLRELETVCKDSARVCLDRAATEALPMPGYTHLQRAVISSTAMWFAGFAEGFIDDALRARQAHDWIDANPLGMAAGYGVNLPLNREYTTQALGFARMQVSPVYAQLSARQVRDCGAGCARCCTARPAPTRMEPVVVHDRRIRLRRATG